jgi:DNA-binding LacI/PurR family transcriptional regulator
MPTNIVDVARHAGVSTATVSRVLSDKPHVSSNVKQRVLDAVDELDYRPSRVARSLRSQRARVIGLIVSDIQNPFFTSLVRGIEAAASADHYAVFLCNADENPEKEAFYIDLMLAEHVSGVIVSPTVSSTFPQTPPVPTTRAYNRLLETKVPVVAIDRRLDSIDVDTVVANNRDAAHQLVTSLINDGHRRIGAVLGVSVVSTGIERYEGYVGALQDRGLPLDLELVHQGVPNTENGRVLARQLLDLEDPPTALFAGNNLLTMGALRAIRERRLSIFKDISVVAFDEMDWMFMVEPPILVAAQPTYEMGQKAVELLFQRMSDYGSPTAEIVFETQVRRAI